MGADLWPGSALAPWFGGTGPRTFERPDRALLAARRREQSAHRQLHDRGAILPPATAAGGAAPRGSTPSGDLHAEGALASSAGRVDAAGSDRRRVPAGDRRPRRTGARGPDRSVDPL